MRARIERIWVDTRPDEVPDNRVGVQAHAQIVFDTDDRGKLVGPVVTTAGLWGIDSASDDAWFHEKAEEERQELEEMLAALGLSSAKASDWGTPASSAGASAIEKVEAMRDGLDAEWDIPPDGDERDKFIEEMDSEDYGRYVEAEATLTRVLDVLRGDEALPPSPASKTRSVRDVLETERSTDGHQRLALPGEPRTDAEMSAALLPHADTLQQIEDAWIARTGDTLLFAQTECLFDGTLALLAIEMWAHALDVVRGSGLPDDEIVPRVVAAIAALAPQGRTAEEVTV